MFRSRKLITLFSVFTVAFFSTTLAFTHAHARSAQDAAIDERGQFVQDKHGQCVRTKWMGEEDPCNPTPPPPPPPAPKVVAPPPPPVVNLEERTIYFDFDSADLNGEAQDKLNELARIINASKAIADVHIIGFTDQFGTQSYNQLLSERRANAVESYLDQRTRIDTSVADIRGLGKAPGSSECADIRNRAERIECMRSERRVEIEFKYQK